MATEYKKTIKPSLGDYTSLSAWESNEQQDLVSADRYAIAEIDGDWTSADSTGVEILGWTTDATRYIEIRTTAQARHSGVFSTSKYRLTGRVNTQTCLQLSVSNVRVIGLQIGPSTNTGCVWLSGSTSGHIVSRCLLTAGTGVLDSNPVGGDGSGTLDNCIVDQRSASNAYGISNSGTGTTFYCYNLTVYGSVTAYEAWTGNIECRNCIGAGTASSVYVANTGSFINCEYNTASDTSTPGTNAKTSVTPSFVNASGGDFHLQSSDTVAKDSGRDLYTASVVAWQYDIDDGTRSGTWDIGADEQGVPVVAEGHQPPINPITFVGAGAQAVSTTSGGTVSAAWPSGYTATAGDLQVIIGAGKHNNGSSLAPSAPSGTGWTQIATQFREVGTYDLQITAWRRILSGGESASTLTVPAAYSTTSGGLSAQCAIFRGTKASAEDATAVTSDSAAAKTWTPTGITTATPGAWVLSMVATADDNALALVSGSEQGFTARMSGANYDTTSGGDHAVGLATKQIDAAGAVTCPTWDQTLVSTDQWAAITWAIAADWKSLPLLQPYSRSFPNLILR